MTLDHVTALSAEPPYALMMSTVAGSTTIDGTTTFTVICAVAVLPFASVTTISVLYVASAIVIGST